MVRHRKRIMAKKLTNKLKAKRTHQQLLTLHHSLDKISTEISWGLKQPLHKELEEDEGDEENGEEIGVMDYIASLSEREKKELRKENPDLPAIFFMTRKQKQQYFAQQNKKFKQALAKVKPRQTKSKKIVRFQPSFDVKPFSLSQRVSTVGKTKSFAETYDLKIHFS